MYPTTTRQPLLRLSSLILLLSTITQVSSLPAHADLRPLPREVSRIAHDELNRRYLAYRSDGSLYGRFSENEMRSVMGMEFDRRGEGLELEGRGPTSCTPLAQEQLKDLPGYDKIDKYFRNLYGTGSANVVTNPKDYPDRGAMVCAQDSAVPVQVKDKPSCQTLNDEVHGEISGTKASGKYTYKFKVGESNSADWTVTTASSLSEGTSFGIDLGIPEIPGLGFSASTTTTTTFANTNTNSFHSQQSTLTERTFEYPVPAGKTCNGKTTTQICTVGASAQVSLVAQGFVWYNFDDATAAKGGDPKDKHYKWCARLEDIMPDAKERSSVVGVTGKMKIQNASTDFKFDCK